MERRRATPPLWFALICLKSSEDVHRSDVEHAWHLYVIQLHLEYLTLDRAQFIEALQANNIGASVHFIPVHLHPYYRQAFGFKRGDFPRTEQTYDRIVSLPLYPKMTHEDIEDVIHAVYAIVESNRRR